MVYSKGLLAFHLFLQLELSTISKAQNLEYFNLLDSTITEINRKYSIYRNIDSVNRNTKFVLNFEKIVKLFSCCLIHLINYEGLDVNINKYPVVISRYDAIKVLYNVQNEILKSSKKNILSHRKRLFKFDKLEESLRGSNGCVFRIGIAPL